MPEDENIPPVVEIKKVITKPIEKEKNLFDMLKLFSPGTSIRTALDDILKSGMGALIAVNTGSLLSIVEGGFKVNTKFSPQKLVELAKMDGAIILSEDMKRILYANTLLSPDIHFPTRETGTRHKAAERTAKHMDAITIAVSERKNKITLYYGKLRHELEASSEILRRATETLQILEKQKETFDDLLIGLNISEISDTTTVTDVCVILQTIEIISRISDVVRRYLIELGREGIIVSMRLKELTKTMNKERDMILEDYFLSQKIETDEKLKSINFDSLLETSNLINLLFGEFHDKSISPRGIRLLSKVHLEEREKSLLLNNFNNLTDIVNADKNILAKSFLDESISDLFIQDIENLKEKILIGKKV
jgi:diadenylate cyclase